jgi:hypothetical protein
MYFALCHGTESGRSAVRDLQGTAERLGYRSNLPRSTLVTLSGPEAVFGGATGEPLARQPGPTAEAPAAPAQPPAQASRPQPGPDQREARPAAPRYQEHPDDGGRRYAERRYERRFGEPDGSFDDGRSRRTFARPDRGEVYGDRSGEWYRAPMRWFGLE